MSSFGERSRCADCDRLAEFEVKEAGVQVAFCQGCLARRTYGLGLTRLAASMRHTPHESQFCLYCRTTVEELQKHAMAGCPLCYQVFPAAIWRSFGLAIP